MTLAANAPRGISRLSFLQKSANVVLTALAAPALAGDAMLEMTAVGNERIPSSGFIDPALRKVEDDVLALMQKHEIPCASLAFMKDGNLMARRAYGYKDPARTIPLSPDTKFRLASLDKPLTATGMEVLCEKNFKTPVVGRLVHKELPIFKVLYDCGVRPPPGAGIDPRIFRLTIRNLMECKDGLNGLPPVQEIRNFLKISRLPSPMDLLRWHLGHPLRFEPGSKHSYSNAAYDTLRAIIHWCTGDFLNFMRVNVFDPAGAKEVGMSRSRPSDREPAEVWYATREKGLSLLAEDRGKEVPITDGAHYWEQHLTMIASAEALVRYLDHWYFGTAKPLRDPVTRRLARGNDNGGSVYYGGYAGTATVMFQRRHSMCHGALLFNHGEERPGLKMSDICKPFTDEIERQKAGNW